MLGADRNRIIAAVLAALLPAVLPAEVTRTQRANGYAMPDE